MNHFVEAITFKEMWIVETTHPGLNNVWFGCAFSYKKHYRWRVPWRRNGFFPGYWDPRFFILTPGWARLPTGFQRTHWLQAVYISWYIRLSKRCRIHKFKVRYRYQPYKDYELWYRDWVKRGRPVDNDGNWV